MDRPSNFQILLSICLGLLASASGAVQESIPVVPSEPDARAYALTNAPSVDGDVLNDPVWQGLGFSTGFRQTTPDEGQPASQRTQVYIGYTEKSLYIAAVMFDDTPESIIVSDSRRDAALDETDSFQVILDSYFDRQNGFVFGTNPAGIQYDGQVTKEGGSQIGSGGGSFNLDWDTSWEVKTQITEIGWSAEMEIPFKSLRYGRNSQPTWGLNFQRNIRRNNETAFWAPLERHHSLYRVSQAGTLSGLSVPKQKNFKITPYALGTAERGTNVDGTDYDNEWGVDLKYSLTPSLTLDATYNTDFAQVEVDKLVVNLNRFSVFLPEKRPFFLENAGQFSVGAPETVELFFSRRIGIGAGGQPLPIDAGLRLSGKVGQNTNIGLLYMSVEDVTGIAPQNDFAVARINRELPNRSAIGAIVVSREGDGSLGGIDKEDDYNRTYGIDGQWGIGDNLLISGYAAKTETPGLDGKDHAFQIKAAYNSEKWFNQVYYTEVAEDFNPEVGFLERSNYKRFSGLLFRIYRPEALWGLHELRPHISYNSYWDFEGKQETERIHIDNHWEYKTGLEFHAGVNLNYDRVDEAFDIIPGQSVQPGDYDAEEVELVFFTNQGAPLSFRVDSKIGDFFGGDRVSLVPTIRYRIGDTFNSELAWNYNRIDLGGPERDFDINVGSLKLAYSFTPKISLEALFQYDDRNDALATNLRFSWLQSANAGLYLVYNEVDLEQFGADRERKELILKFSYIFDVL